MSPLSIIYFYKRIFISINTRLDKVRSRHWDIFDILLRLKRTNSITPREKNRERGREKTRESSEHWAKYADSVGGCYAFAVIPTKNGSISVALQRYEKGSTNWRPIHSVSSSGSHKKATHLDFLTDRLFARRDCSTVRQTLTFWDFAFAEFSHILITWQRNIY